MIFGNDGIDSWRLSDDLSKLRIELKECAKGIEQRDQIIKLMRKALEKIDDMRDTSLIGYWCNNKNCYVMDEICTAQAMGKQAYEHCANVAKEALADIDKAYP